MPTTRPCGMQWHYGTLVPVNHSDPNSRAEWSGIHGKPTANPSGLCSACEREWRMNYPGFDLPEPITIGEPD